MMPAFDVIVPVHNEAVKLAQTAVALKQALATLPGQVIYVLNGTHDHSAAVIRQVFGNNAQIITLAKAGKTRALNAGDAASEALFRVYLDADVTVTGETFYALLAPLLDGSADLVAPRLISDFDEMGGLALRVARVWADQLNRRGDAFMCCTAFNKQGLTQRGPWPEVLADDDWARDQIMPSRRLVVDAAQAHISPPRKIGSWLVVRSRWRRGARQLKRLGNRKHVAAPKPRGSLIDLGVYFTVQILAEPLSYALPIFGVAWGKDTSTRDSKNE